MHEFQPKPKTQNLVAILQKDAASPAFLVTVNVDDRTMTVRPVAAHHEAGKSYELWIVQDSLGTPKSLGVIDEPHAMTRPTLAAYKRDVIESATFAVSLEPEGGSPTGAPTGPVVFAGKLIAQTF
jgi:anti-sigma-K factor RskA